MYIDEGREAPTRYQILRSLGDKYTLCYDFNKEGIVELPKKEVTISKKEFYINANKEDYEVLKYVPETGKELDVIYVHKEQST